jgi:hypothetical protein
MMVHAWITPGQHYISQNAAISATPMTALEQAVP